MLSPVPAAGTPCAWDSHEGCSVRAEGLLWQQEAGRERERCHEPQGAPEGRRGDVPSKGSGSHFWEGAGAARRGRRRKAEERGWGVSGRKASRSAEEELNAARLRAAHSRAGSCQPGRAAGGGRRGSRLQPQGGGRPRGRGSAGRPSGPMVRRRDPAAARRLPRGPAERRGAARPAGTRLAWGTCRSSSSSPSAGTCGG